MALIFKTALAACMEGNGCYRSSAHYFHGMLFERARARFGDIAAKNLMERARATAVLKIAYRGGWGGVLILGTFLIWRVPGRTLAQCRTALLSFPNVTGTHHNKKYWSAQMTQRCTALVGLGSITPCYLCWTALVVKVRVVLFGVYSTKPHYVGCTVLYRVIWVVVQHDAVLLGLDSIICNGACRAIFGEPHVVVNVAFVTFL
jgi:hypothetical protein